MGPDGVAPRRSVVAESSIGSGTTVGERTTPQGGRLRPGDVLLDRYTVLAELGEGGMGVVYKCLDTIGRIEVALKCLPPELSRNESEMEGIRENYAIVARLHHSAISGLRQLEKDPDFGEYYLVMDLAKGEDLSKILHRRHGVPMPLDEALAILHPLASALDYAHGEHVLHRDVKPANVKVETLPAEASQPSQVQSSEFKVQSSGETRQSDELNCQTVKPSNCQTGIRVQLLDFGLAAEVRASMSRVSLRGHVGSSGTPDYMAPEQWEARHQSAATDQYSLAVMAYEMLSGYRPFEADNMEVLKSAVLTRPPDEIEDVPAHVNAALQKALAKNPKERFASCGEFVEALERQEIPGGSRSRATAAGGPPAPRQDGANSQGAPQRENHTEAEGHEESVSGAAKPETRIPNPASTSTVSEADVLRRKLALTRALKAISAEDRADNEFAKFVERAEDELVVAEEACKFGRFAVAAESLNVAEKALDDLRKAKQVREEAERKAKEEAERKAKEEAERRAKEEAERKAKEDVERRARRAAERRAEEETLNGIRQNIREHGAEWNFNVKWCNLWKSIVALLIVLMFVYGLFLLTGFFTYEIIVLLFLSIPPLLLGWKIRAKAEMVLWGKEDIPSFRDFYKTIGRVVAFVLFYAFYCWIVWRTFWSQLSRTPFEF